MADEIVNTKAVEPTVDATVAESTAAVTTEDKTEDVKTEDAKTETKNEDDTADVKDKSENGDSKDSAMLKTTGQINYKNRRKNNKFDASILPETDDPSQIRGQVEFYFSDNNLPKDEFLWNLTGGSENTPVSLQTICSFKRMRRFKPYEAVVKALRESKILDVTGEEGKENVSRKSAYDPARPVKILHSSVYVKGFGDEKPSTQFDIEAFFAKFDHVNAIRLRRTPEGLFKGSVFAEFETEEQAKAFLELDPAPTWEGHELKIMSKKAYVEGKNQLIAEGKLQPSESHSFWQGKRGNRHSGGGRGGRGGKPRNGDPDDWKSRKEDDRKNGFRGRGRGRGGRGRGGGNGRRDRRDRDDKNDDKPSKRSRAEDGVNEEPPAKRVDAKSESAATETTAAA